MTGPTRPLTGAEYLESIRDDREIYLYGERVADVTEHPAFRNPARMIARLYNALHDPEYRNVLTTATDAGGPGGYTHRFFTTPHSAEDLVADQQAIAAWSRLTYGWMGRSPDYKASLLGTLGANAEFYNPFADNARRWYRESQEKVLYWNHAIVNPPVDRHRPPDQVGDVFVHVERETDSGVIVSGAKVVATNSALTHYNFLAHTGLPIKDRRFAIVATVPMSAPGLKLICRQSYSAAAEATGSPFDYPLSSRLDENDSILVLDKVLIPWENVFIYGDVAKVGMFGGHSGFVERAMFHGSTRLAVKLEFMAGLLAKALDITGAADFHGVQTRLGEVLAWRNLFWGLSDAAARNPVAWRGDAVLPNPDYIMAYRWFSQVGYNRVREIVLQDVASGLIYLPSSAKDFRNEDIRPYLDTYLRGSHGVDAVDRVKVMKLLWDTVGTEFGGRHDLYERNYSGNHENTRIELLRGQIGDGKMDGYREFVDRCLAEYDLDGWRAPDLAPVGNVTMGQYPLTSRQRDPNHVGRAPEHVVALTFRIRGELRVDALRGALDDVVERHESLRTRISYHETDGNLGFQEVLPPLPVPLTVHDVPVPPGRSRDDIAVDLLNKLNDERLPFTALPSLRASLHRFDDRDAVLTLITHHLFSDGWSGGILRREITACYLARVTGIPHELPTPVPYRDYASWEQDFLAGEKGAAARRFWQDTLAGAELLAMPADRPHGPDTLLPRPSVGNFSIDPTKFAEVRASAARNRCSVWHVILAALMVLADKLTRRSDITLLTVNSGRSNPEFQNTVGLFADLVPIRLDFGDCRSVLDLLRLARRASTDAQQYQIPFGMIPEMFPDLMKTVEDPRFVVPGFNYISSSWAQDDGRSAISLDQVIPPEEPPGYFLRGAFKWNFRVAAPGEFRCIVEYEPDAVDASTVDRWGSDFVSLILAIADKPDQDWQNL